MTQTDLFPDEAADQIREAECCEYIANGWRVSAIHARRDGFPDAAKRYDREADHWAAKARDCRDMIFPASCGAYVGGSWPPRSNARDEPIFYTSETPNATP